jgi:hypothetical protein
MRASMAVICCSTAGSRSPLVTGVAGMRHLRLRGAGADGAGQQAGDEEFGLAGHPHPILIGRRASWPIFSVR